MTETFRHLSVEQCQQKLDQQENIVLIDIRREDDYAQGHIDGALHVDEPQARALMHVASEQALVICCYRGNSSRAFAQRLVEQGFDEVYSLDGGYEAWQSLVSC